MQIKPIELIHTPGSWRDIEAWLEKLSGGERYCATVGAGMAWNLAAALTAPKSKNLNKEAPRGPRLKLLDGDIFEATPRAGQSPAEALDQVARYIGVTIADCEWIDLEGTRDA